MAIQQTKQTKEEEQIVASRTIQYQLPKKALRNSNLTTPSSPASKKVEWVKTILLVTVLVAILVGGYILLKR